MISAPTRGRAVLFRMTSDEFCKLPPSEPFKLELFDGKVVMAARPTPYHQHFVSELMVVLKQWVKEQALGRVLFDTLMKLDIEWTPAPDLVFLAADHLHRVKRKRIVGPVDLAVEVLSPSDKHVDRKTKFDAYARFGIPAYWIVDLDKRVLEEYELGKGAYSKKVTVPFDRPFAPKNFPGLQIDLASLEW